MKYINYLLLVLGAVLAMYAKQEANQNILIIGIAILMVGIYRIAKTIPSKEANLDDKFVEEEDDE